MQVAGPGCIEPYLGPAGRLQAVAVGWRERVVFGLGGRRGAGETQNNKVRNKGVCGVGWGGVGGEVELL